MEKIILEGAKNIRDLGGIHTTDGKVIKRGRLIRSDKLSGLTIDDIEKLRKKYGLNTIIDLRTKEELNQSPDVKMEGIKYIFNPLFEQKALGMTHENNNKLDLLSMTDEGVDAVPPMEDLYRLIVQDDNSIQQMKKVFDIFINNDNGAVLWHCTEGKDRCGMVSALILFALGVPEDVIITDYLLTNEVNSVKANHLRNLVLEKSGNEKIANKISSYYLAKEEYYHAAFDYIKDNYGCVESYLDIVLGITKDMRDKLKELYCR